MTERRVLLVAATTGYQTRAFEEAGRRMGVRLQYATDRCHMLDDPWRDAAIPIRFDRPAASADAIAASAATRPVDGVLAVGDAPALVAALAAERLGLPFHGPDGALAGRDKFVARERLSSAGLPTPGYRRVPRTTDPRTLDDIAFPCVVKPLGLSGSRGVIRADDRAGLVAAFERVRALLESLPQTRTAARREPAQAGTRQAGHEADEHTDAILVEQFVPGHEFAVDGVMTAGDLHVLAVFDKPDPLDGPFFEETIYVTPPPVSESVLAAITQAVADGASAMGLSHGPVHAECRVNADGVFIVEIAARPIGGLCARALRFVPPDGGVSESLEFVLLHDALGMRMTGWTRESEASGAMMIPVPRRGVLRHVGGVEAARAVRGVTEVHITARIDDVLVPVPEGASYLGFIFARAERCNDVVKALRSAHACLAWSIAPDLRMVQSQHG